MQIEFFALIFFYIYIGNILFLFLFFIILSDDKKSFHYIGNEEQTPLFYRMYGILILILVKIVYSFSYSTKALAYSYIYWSPLIKINSLGDPQMLAYILFFHYFYCLILIAIMFLYTMIGITFLFADYFNK
jgi:NADH:ubiquinone oxidoreductase subunit 6 (subunit J)